MEVLCPSLRNGNISERLVIDGVCGVRGWNNRGDGIHFNWNVIMRNRGRRGRRDLVRSTLGSAYRRWRENSGGVWLVGVDVYDDRSRNSTAKNANTDGTVAYTRYFRALVRATEVWVVLPVRLAKSA